MRLKEWLESYDEFEEAILSRFHVIMLKEEDLSPVLREAMENHDYEIAWVDSEARRVFFTIHTYTRTDKTGVAVPFSALTL